MIDRFGLDEPSIGMGLEELWERIQSALVKIVGLLSLESAALFHSGYRDFYRMELRAFCPPNPTPPNSFSLASYEELEWLESESWVEVPRESGPLSWLMPKPLLGVERGVLFGREIVGHVVLVCFGCSDQCLRSPIRRGGLQDAVGFIFRFLASGLTAADLDNLMAETGHLMGRAVGKVMVGVDALKSIISLPEKAEDAMLFDAALWAIEDGERRLELVRQNFYAFQFRRRQASDLDQALYAGESFDVLRELAAMRHYFDRRALEERLKSILWYLGAGEEVIVIGDRHAFRLVLLNLFDNAFKFSYSNTFLTVNASRDGRNFEMSITNLGVGVAPDEFMSVFQPLYRSRYRDPVRRIEGLGIGLSYCRRIIEDMFGGKISLTSSKATTPHHRRFEGDNWLTTVKVVLPLGREGN